MSAENGGRGDRRDKRTGIENVYGRRRFGNGPKAAGQRDEGGIRARAGVTHLAGALAFLLVMHRTDLAGEHPRAAFVVRIAGGHALAAERERCRGNTCDLAHEPAANHPGKMAPDKHMTIPDYHGDSPVSWK